MNYLRCLFGISLLSPLAGAEPWTTSRLQGSPEPPAPFVSEPVFGRVELRNVTDMVPVPGLAQWLIAEDGEKIWWSAPVAEPPADSGDGW
jgi:hypothetical protein